MKASLFALFLLLCLIAGEARAGEVAPDPAATSEGADAVRVILKAEKEATLSLEVAGRITRIHKKMGEAFRAGELLIEIDDTQYAAAVRKAQAVCDAAESVLKATQELAGRREVPQMELANARRDHDVAQAELTVARRDLLACRIVAPFAGNVLQLMVREHELVNAASAVIAVISNLELYAHFLLPEELYPRLRLQRKMALEFPAPAGRVEAIIVRISPALDPLSHTFEVHASVDNHNGLLQAGMSGWFAPGSLPLPVNGGNGGGL